MNARTQISATGDIALPGDVLARLHWGPGTPLELVEPPGGVSLRSPRPTGGRSSKSLADLDALPSYEGQAQPVEAISKL